jgi:CHAD domain-containing protein
VSKNRVSLLGRIDTLKDSLRSLRGGRFSSRRVHQARVAMRRITTLLVEFDDKKSVHALIKILKLCRRSMADLRAYDVFVRLLKDTAEKLMFYKTAKHILQKQRSKASLRISSKPIRRAFKSVRLFREGWREHAAFMTRQNLLGRARAVISKAVETLNSEFKTYDAAKWHKSRLRLKQARYLIESSGDTDFGDVLAALRALQNDLGELHDLHEFIGWLKKIGAKKQAMRGKQRRVLKNFVAKLEVAQKASSRSLMDSWPERRQILSSWLSPVAPKIHSVMGEAA